MSFISGWLLFALTGGVLITAILCLPLGFDFDVQIGSGNRIHYRIHFALWHWQGNGTSPKAGSDLTERDNHSIPKSKPNSQSGFLSIPVFKKGFWRKSLKDLGKTVRVRAQRGLFHLLTYPAFWGGCLRYLFLIPKRSLHLLNWKWHSIVLSHSKPEVLGQWAAWGTSLSYSMGYDLPLAWNFEVREFRCSAAFRVQASLFQWLVLFGFWVWDFPWRALIVGFGKGFIASKLSGWRQKAFDILQWALKNLPASKPATA